MSSREMFDLEPGDTGEALLPTHAGHDYPTDGWRWWCVKCNPIPEADAEPSAEADKVNDKGAHSDRDASEAPTANKVNGRGAWLPEGSDPVWGDVRHHRERIDQLKGWVTYWKAKADKAEARVVRATETLDAHGQWYSGPLLYRAMCEALDMEAKP